MDGETKSVGYSLYGMVKRLVSIKELLDDQVFIAGIGVGTGGARGAIAPPTL